MKYSLDICNFLKEISNLSDSVIFLYFFTFFIYTHWKYPSRMKQKSRDFHMKRNRNNLLQAHLYERRASENSLSRREMLKDETLEHQEWEKNTVKKKKTWMNKIDSLSFVFFKLCMLIKAKILTLCNVVLSECMYRRCVRQSYYKERGRKRYKEQWGSYS